MPYTKINLQNKYSLSPEDVDNTLVACGLAIDLTEYSDEDIESGFDVIRQYFAQGRVSDYSKATELFRQELQKLESTPQLEVNSQSKPKKNKNQKNSANSKTLNISQLLSKATEQVGTLISLTEALKIIQACGLSDQEEYNQESCDRFLEACNLIKQGKSFEEVATHFSINLTGTCEQNTPDIIDSISDSTASSEAGLINLVDRVTSKRAEIIPGLVNQMYLNNVVDKLINSQDDIQSFYAQLEERILEQIEGKSRLGSMARWKIRPLPPSSPKPIQLPPESENGTSIG